MPYEPLPAHVDLPAMEREILARWQAEDVFARSLAQTADGPSWIFYEGPPTANGHPGTHHIEARVFKDVFPRFRTMKGYSVPRRRGTRRGRRGRRRASTPSRRTTLPSPRARSR